MSPSETTPAPGPAGRVGYVLKMYPRFSETFVVNELLAQEAAGTEVDVFSLRPPVDARFHAALAQVQAPVTWVACSSVRAGEAWAQLGEAADRLPGLAGLWPELLRHDLRDVLQAVEVASAVRERGLVHLHAHFGSVATTVARLAALLSGVGYSFTAHAKDIFHSSVDDDDLRTKLREARTVVTVSDHNLEHLRQRFGADADRVVRIYNGIDLLDAEGLLAADGDPVTCDLLGSGELMADLAAQVTALGLQDRVRLLGPRTQEEVVEALASAAVMAAPCVVGEDGNRDGLPTVVLEAMALGTPVVATPVTGVPEAVRHGATGLLVPEHSPVALADALRRLLDDEQERVRLAAGARELVQQHFDRRDQARRLRAVLAAAVGRPDDEPGAVRADVRQAVPA